MSQEHVLQFLQEAQKSIASGHLQQGLDLLEQALALDSNCGEGHMMRGVVLSQLDRPHEASLSFEDALKANSLEPKIYYNFAVHLYHLGEKGKAEEMAKQTLLLNPDHLGAKNVLGDPGVASIQTEPFAELPKTPQGVFRGGYDTSSVGSIGFITNMGRGWVVLGLGLSVLGIALFVFTVMTNITEAQRVFSGTGNSNIWGSQGPMQRWGFSLQLILSLTSMVWMILDLMHRRGNWVWFFPFILCCCCHSGGLIQLIYIWKGRD